MKGLVTSYGRIRRAAFFMLLALGAETLSTFWHHPLSFYFFLASAGLLLLLAGGSFLLSWFSPHAKPESWAAITPIEETEETKKAASG
jgi:hypothetical protein